MLLAHSFNPKIIDYQCERDRVGKMLPKAWGMFTFVITMGEETFLEQLVRQDAYLGKAPHSLTHFKIYKPVLCKRVQIVLLPSPGWEEGEWHLHVFVP
jgi:hypothetical protein